MSSGFSWARRSDYVTSPVPPEEDGEAVGLASSQFTSLSDQDRPHDSMYSDMPSAAFESPHEYRSYVSFEIPSRATSSAKMASSSNDSSFFASRFACSWPSCSLTFPRLSERDRHYITDHANNRDRPYKCDIEECQANVTTWARADKLRRHNKQWHGPYHCRFANCARRYPCGFASPSDLNEHIDSVHGGDVGGGSNQSMTTTYTPEQLTMPGEGAAEGSSVGVASAPQNYSSHYPVPDSEQFAAVPRWGGRPPTTIHTRDPGTNPDELPPEFKVHESKRFKFGKVFKIIWSEPRGTDGTDISGDDTSMSKHTFRKFRRFVIINNFAGHSLCLPILTYSGQGTLKRGVHASDHAVIYTDKSKGPTMLPRECLTKAALRMEPENSRHKLHLASRVNYAKVYTVEHNVKVQFIGTLARNAQAQLIADYNSQHPPLPEIDPDPGYSVQRSSALDWNGESWDHQSNPAQSQYNSQTFETGGYEQQTSSYNTCQNDMYNSQWNSASPSDSIQALSHYAVPLQVSTVADQYGHLELASSGGSLDFETRI